VTECRRLIGRDNRFAGAASLERRSETQLADNSPRGPEADIHGFDGPRGIEGVERRDEHVK
jgi:hypothetical protein